MAALALKSTVHRPFGAARYASRWRSSGWHLAGETNVGPPTNLTCGRARLVLVAFASMKTKTNVKAGRSEVKDAHDRYANIEVSY
jgi:hypothetical protein